MKENLMNTVAIDAYYKRDFMSTDIPNAFIQAGILELEDCKKRFCMKITRELVDMLIGIALETHSGFVVCRNGLKLIYHMKRSYARTE